MKGFKIILNMYDCSPLMYSRTWQNFIFASFLVLSDAILLSLFIKTLSFQGMSEKRNTLIFREFYESSMSDFQDESFACFLYTVFNFVWCFKTQFQFFYFNILQSRRCKRNNLTVGFLFLRKFKLSTLGLFSLWFMR